MILDVLPLEVMREVLLDLSTVDIIQTVKCTRRLYHFAKVDKALGRRLQNRVFDLHLRLGNIFWMNCECEDPVPCLYLGVRFRQANDAVAQWNSSECKFVFWFGDQCKCNCIKAGFWYGGECDDLGGPTLEIEHDLLDHPSFLYDSHLLGGFENETSFTINNGSLDEAIVNCSKLFNILMKFCVVRKLKLDFDNNDDHMWDKMNAFFNANPPDLRIQPHVLINSGINLDSFSIFPNGLAEIAIFSDYNFGRILADAYHEVFRRTPKVSFLGMDLPYTYEDLLGFFKDTKQLSIRSKTHITKQQIRQLVQHFYEVKHDEERTFEFGGFAKQFRVKDFLTLVPKEAYRLHKKRRGNMDMTREWRMRMTWAEMTDRFGGRWALMDVRAHYNWEFCENVLRICSMKNFTENKPIGVSDLADFD